MNFNINIYCFGRLSPISIFVILLFLLSGCATTSKPSKTGGHATKQVTLAVWDFDNNSPSGGELDHLGKTLSEELLTHLSSSPNIKLVERKFLQQVLEEQHLSISQLASEETRLKLGRLAGANFMAFGSYMEMGSQIRVDVRVVDVETSQVKFSENINGTLQDTASQMQTLAKNIAFKFGPQAAFGYSAKDS